MTVNKPFRLSPNRPNRSVGMVSAAYFFPSPFRRASGSARNVKPGYSWLPRLYQERCQSSTRPLQVNKFETPDQVALLNLLLAERFAV